MNNLKNYSKPVMIAEKFVPNSYCVICEDKHVVEWQLSNPYPSWQHFVIDDNDNYQLDLSDLDHIQTTDHSRPHPDVLVVNAQPSVCWPSDVANPTSLSQVHENEMLWYVKNDHTSSGHVYGYQTMVEYYNHS